MQTSWSRHRRHVVASLAFRAVAVSGFAVGLAVAIFHSVPAPRACDMQHAPCMARLLRYEAVAHVLPPVAGLVAGTIVGALLARGVHRAYSRSSMR